MNGVQLSFGIRPVPFARCRPPTFRSHTCNKISHLILRFRHTPMLTVGFTKRTDYQRVVHPLVEGVLSPPHSSRQSAETSSTGTLPFNPSSPCTIFTEIFRPFSSTSKQEELLRSWQLADASEGKRMENFEKKDDSGSILLVLQPG